MKRAIKTMMTGFLASAALFCVNGQNFIENSDFENGISEWKMPTWKNKWLAPVHDKANTQGIGGSSSLRIDWKNGYTFYVVYHKIITIPAGMKEVEISFWTKSRGYEKATKGRMNIQVEYPELGKSKGWTAGVITPWNKTQEDWTLFENTFKIPDNVTKMKIVMKLHGNKNNSGTSWIDNIYVGPVRVREKEKTVLPQIDLYRGISTCDHGGVYYPGEPITYSYEIRNNKLAEKTVDFSWQINDYDGNKIIAGTRKVTLPEKDTGTFQIKFPEFKYMGWFAIKGKLSDQGKKLDEVTSSGMIVEKQTGKRDPFFTAKGGGTYERQRRMGNGSVGYFVQRRFLQTGPDSYNPKILGNIDKFIKNCKDYGFEPFFQFYISQALNVKQNPKQPKYLFDSINEKLAKGIDPYDAAYYQTWRNMFAMMFKRYNKEVQDWYIADEIYHSYSISKYEVPHYISILKILNEEVKKKDPTNMIGGGNTFMDRDPIGKKMWPDVKDYVDGLVCSLYLGSTTAGKGMKVTSPEEWGLLKSFAHTRSIIGNKKFISSTESGYSFLDFPAIDGAITKQVATIVARNMVLLKALNVRKWTYFTFINDGMYESKKWGYGRIDYGMWNKASGCPKPHAAAWAAAARMLAFVENPVNASPHGDVYCFVFRKGAKTLAAIWAYSKDGVESVINMPSDWKGMDFIGRPIQGKAGKTSLRLNEQVLYMEMDTPQEEVIKAFRNGKYILPELYVTLIRENGGNVAVCLKNKTGKELSVSVKLNKFAQKKINVKANSLSKVLFPCPPGQQKLEVTAVANGLKYTISKEDEWYPVAKLSAAPSIRNGMLTGFEKVTPLIMDSTKNLMPDNADGHGFWTGKDDLSAKVYLGYDKQYFYLGVEAADEAHISRAYGVNSWNQDSVQFGFDTANNAIDSVLFPGGYDEDDREFIMADTPKGSELFCYNGTPDIERKLLEKPQVVRTQGKTLYLARMPWKYLGNLKGISGSVFGFNIVVFDTDDPKKAISSHMDFSKGITYGKAPAMFKRFILE